MVFLFYELALHPDQAEKLHAELLSIDIHDRKALQALPHLNGCIQETLRLHPPVPSGGYRETPPEGITVAGQYIPGHTTIVSPRYSLGRRTSFFPSPFRISFLPDSPSTVESCFQQPLQFIPERWSTQPDLIRDKRGHAPFSQGTPFFSQPHAEHLINTLLLGRYACVGKNLALAELRFVTALLARKYRVRFAPPPAGEGGREKIEHGRTGEDEGAGGGFWWRRVETEMRDQFTAAPGQLELVFEKR